MFGRKVKSAATMSRIAVLQIVFVCALPACALAQSQQPGSSTNAQGRGDNQPATQPPINITVTTPQPSPEAAKRDEDRQERNVATQEDIRDFTRVLSILAGVQAAITFVALLAAIRSANAAKNSADIATVALHIAERARLNVVGFEFGVASDGMATAKILIRNTGNLPGRITERAAVVYMNEPLPTPDQIPWEFNQGGVVAPPGHTFQMRQPFTFPIFAEHWKAVVAGTTQLWICGVIRYETGFDEIKGETGWGVYFDASDTGTAETKRFSVINSGGHNYTQ